MCITIWISAKRLFHELKRVSLLCFFWCKTCKSCFNWVLLFIFFNRSNFLLLFLCFRFWLLLLSWLFLLWLLHLNRFFLSSLLPLVILVRLLLYLCHFGSLLFLFLRLPLGLLYKKSFILTFSYFLHQSLASHSRSSFSFLRR